MICQCDLPTASPAQVPEGFTGVLTCGNCAGQIPFLEIKAGQYNGKPILSPAELSTKKQAETKAAEPKRCRCAGGPTVIQELPVGFRGRVTCAACRGIADTTAPVQPVQEPVQSVIIRLLSSIAADIGALRALAEAPKGKASK